MTAPVIGSTDYWRLVLEAVIWILQFMLYAGLGLGILALMDGLRRKLLYNRLQEMRRQDQKERRRRGWRCSCTYGNMDQCPVHGPIWERALQGDLRALQALGRLHPRAIPRLGPAPDPEED